MRRFAESEFTALSSKTLRQNVDASFILGLRRPHDNEPSTTVPLLHKRNAGHPRQPASAAASQQLGIPVPPSPEPLELRAQCRQIRAESRLSQRPPRSRRPDSRNRIGISQVSRRIELWRGRIAGVDAVRADRLLETLVTRVKKNNCPMGKCMQVGFHMNVFTFLPVIDTIAYDTENRVPVWAHVKVVASIEGRQRSRETSEYKMGPLLSNTTVEVADIYNREYQRRRLGSIFDDPERSEWYLSDIIPNDEKYFVEGQLISPDELYYRLQQSGTYFYENTVPMWKSVLEGNWRYVSSIVRKLASETMTDLDVWSGSIGVLTLQSSSGVQRKVFLARDGSGKSILPVPKLLFKYVHDRKLNRGLAFIVVNNPFLDKVYTGDLVICKRQIVCENLFPQFAHLDRGYTYCCTLDGFLETAKSLGLPTFNGATSIGSY